MCFLFVAFFVSFDRMKKKNLESVYSLPTWIAYISITTERAYIILIYLFVIHSAKLMFFIS